MRPIEYASLSDADLQRKVVDTNGDRDAVAEMRRRSLDAKLGGGAGRSPAELLRWLERRKNGPDLRTPAERVIWLAARKHVTAHGVAPRELLLQLQARRISGGW